MKLWAISESELNHFVYDAKQQLKISGEIKTKDYDTTQISDSILIIPVHGILFKRENYFTKHGWGISYERLYEQIHEAVEDTTIKKIMLHIDSPGGEYDGIIEFSDSIRRLSARKQIISHVSGMAASGGYWIASATDHINAHRNSYLGSIGVIATMYDFSTMMEEMGIKEYVFVSEVSPEKYQDLKEEEGRDVIQSMVNEAGDIFVSEVARNRAVEKRLVLTDYGKGNILLAEKAVGVRMIDSINDIEGYIALQNEVTNMENLEESGMMGLKTKSNLKIQEQKPAEEEEKEVQEEEERQEEQAQEEEEMEAGCDGYDKESQEEEEEEMEARIEKAVMAERKRIQTLESLAGSFPHDKELMKSAKFVHGWDANTFIQKQAELSAKKGKQVVSELDKDAGEIPDLQDSQEIKSEKIKKLEAYGIEHAKKLSKVGAKK